MGEISDRTSKLEQNLGHFRPARMDEAEPDSGRIVIMNNAARPAHVIHIVPGVSEEDGGPSYAVVRLCRELSALPLECT